MVVAGFAHRLTTIRNADRIVVTGPGVAEQGTQTDLLAA